MNLFSRQEIASKQFSAKHSSILRILTKWAGYLQEIFDDPQDYVERRAYSFKTIDNKLVTLKKTYKSSGRLI